MSHRRDIEGLRALAVVAVLLFHFGVPGTAGGFVGVDVFFVISGYLITALLLEERHRSGTISIRRFYARRARRLLPISTVVLVATACAGRAMLDVTRVDTLVSEVRAAALFGANLLFAQRGTDYLTASLEPSPLLHFWSLAVEEQFYVVWPGLIALVTLGARSPRAVVRRVAVTMAVVVALSYAASGLMTSTHPSWSYFGLHTRAWELGVGALVAAAGPAVAGAGGVLRAVSGWVGVVAIVVSVMTFDRVDAFPGWSAAIPVLATAFVLAAGTPPGPDDVRERPRRWGPSMLLDRAPLQYVGSRSYSLYVWHWPVLILAAAHHGGPLSAPTRLGLAVAVVVVADLGHRWIEHPIRTSATLVARPGWSVAIGALLVVTGLVSSVVVSAAPATPSTGVVATAPLLDVSTTATLPAPGPSTSTAPRESTPVSTAPVEPAPITMAGVETPRAVVDALANVVLPDNLRPSLVGAKDDVPVIYDDGCHLYLSPTVRDGCVFGDPDGEITVALWGDSHAAQWFTPLEQIAEQRGWRLLSLTQGGCPFLDVAVYNLGAKKEFTHCQAWRDDVRRTLVEQGVDVVVMSQYQRLIESETRDWVRLERWQTLLPSLLDGLRADGIEPVLVADVPRPERSVPACLDENRSDITSCTVAVDTERVAEIDTWLRGATGRAGVGFVEPTAWLCADGRCPPVVGDLLVYRDDNHLSNQFAASLTPLLDASIGGWIDRFVAARAAVG